MGPVVLITVGVLFLLSTFDIWGFHRSWPILLIAIGLVHFLSNSAATAGHVPPTLPDVFAHGCAPASYPPPQNPPQAGTPSVAPGQQSSPGVDHV